MGRRERDRRPSGDQGWTKIRAVMKGRGSAVVPTDLRCGPITKDNILSAGERKVWDRFICNPEFECLIVICSEYRSPLSFRPANSDLKIQCKPIEILSTKQPHRFRMTHTISVSSHSEDVPCLAHVWFMGFVKSIYGSLVPMVSQNSNEPEIVKEPIIFFQVRLLHD
jgi:hypothetical protein